MEFRDVSVNHEGLVFRGGYILPQSFVRDMDARHYRRRSRYFGFRVRNALRRTVRMDAGLWIVDNFSPGNYFHWMTECLPRLASVTEPPDTLLLPRYYHTDTYIDLTLSAFPEVLRIRWIGRMVKVRVDTLVCPPRVAPIGQYGVELHEVARRVGSLCGNAGSRRLYCTRRNAARRRLVNHSAVQEMLAGYGFEELIVEPTRPAHQIEAMKSAECLVAVHGAELTNLMFMHSGSTVIELRHSQDGVFWDCYRPLAEAFGLEYQAMLCAHEPAEGYEVNHADLTVDVDELEAMVAAALKRHADDT